MKKQKYLALFLHFECLFLNKFYQVFQSLDNLIYINKNLLFYESNVSIKS